MQNEKALVECLRLWHNFIICIRVSIRKEIDDGKSSARSCAGFRRSV